MVLARMFPASRSVKGQQTRACDAARTVLVGGLQEWNILKGGKKTPHRQNTVPRIHKVAFTVSLIQRTYKTGS